MKVHELVEKLIRMPQNAEVFVHSSMDECDDRIKDVKVCHRVDPEYGWQMKQYYCQADSFAAIYLDEHPEENEVVVIGFNE